MSEEQEWQTQSQKSDEDVRDELLVSHVEKCRHLYDKKDPLFKDTIAKENGWKSISEIVKIDAEQRFIVLRRRYGLEKKKTVRPTGSQSYEEPKWHLLKLMGFLDSHIKPRKTKSNYKPPPFETVSEAGTSGTTSGSSAAGSDFSRQGSAISSTSVDVMSPEDINLAPGEYELDEADGTLHYVEENSQTPSSSGNEVKDAIENSTTSESTKKLHGDATSMHTPKRKQQDLLVGANLNEPLCKFSKLMDIKVQESTVFRPPVSDSSNVASYIASTLDRIKNQPKKLKALEKIFSVLSDYADSDDDM